MSFKLIFPYIIASGFVLFGMYLALTGSGLSRDFGWAIIMFFSALILHGLTKQNHDK